MKNTIIVILALLLGLVSKSWFNQYKNNREIESNYKVIMDTLTTFKNKNGELISKIRSFETEKIKDFLNLKTKDSLTLKLQKEVKTMKKLLRKQGSVTYIESESKIDTIFITKVRYDTIASGDLKYYPIYESSFNLDDWVVGETIAKKDYTKVNLKIKDKYSVTVAYEKGVPIAYVKSENPFNVVRNMKTYQVKVKQKRFGIGPQISFYPKIKNGTIGIGMTPAIGLNYNLISW